MRRVIFYTVNEGVGPALSLLVSLVIFSQHFHVRPKAEPHHGRTRGHLAEPCGNLACTPALLPADAAHMRTDPSLTTVSRDIKPTSRVGGYKRATCTTRPLLPPYHPPPPRLQPCKCA